eukprot:TRINITY_DN330_c0_g2_i1.p1 TRINITY_DN330_c0_g2~~TRINITY_DN330_c0_g2_i1.p1  ORF type:complete len:381 (+),score=69.72 TRINITY_DN330_c0_g2_i1:43-1143(+)
MDEKLSLNNNAANVNRTPWWKDIKSVTIAVLVVVALVLVIVIATLPDGDDDEPKAAKAKLRVKVVSVDWVKSLVDWKYADGERPDDYPYPRTHEAIIYETARGNSSYLAGHIPHSVHSDADDYEVGYPTNFLKDNAGLEMAARRNGLCNNPCTVVIYADNPVYASRLWYILSYMGVKDVRVMNGTFSAWAEKVYPVSMNVLTLNETRFKANFVKEARMNAEDVQKVYSTNEVQMVDVRSTEEYEGTSSGSPNLVEKGRIPYALWGTQANKGSYTDNNSMLHPPSTILGYWRAGNINVNSTAPPYFYCASGYRASLALLYASLMDVPASVYPDGWWDWSTTWVHNATYDEPPTPGWEQLPSGRDIYP